MSISRSTTTSPSEQHESIRPEIGRVRVLKSARPLVEMSAAAFFDKVAQAKERNGNHMAQMLFPNKYEHVVPKSSRQPEPHIGHLTVEVTPKPEPAEQSFAKNSQVDETTAAISGNAPVVEDQTAKIARLQAEIDEIHNLAGVTRRGL